MKSVKAVFAGCALAAMAAGSCSAATLGHRGGAGIGAAMPGGQAPASSPAGRSRLAYDNRTAFPWRDHGDHRRDGRNQTWWGTGYYAEGLGLPYEDAAYGDVDCYAPGPYGPPEPYGPLSPYGPLPPYGAGFRPIAAPMEPALAPLAYGPGAHDGAYAYGYNGYAQTPPLP